MVPWCHGAMVSNAVNYHKCLSNAVNYRKCLSHAPFDTRLYRTVPMSISTIEYRRKGVTRDEGDIAKGTIKNRQFDSTPERDYILSECSRSRILQATKSISLNSRNCSYG